MTHKKKDYYAEMMADEDDGFLSCAVAIAILAGGMMLLGIGLGYLIWGL